MLVKEFIKEMEDDGEIIEIYSTLTDTVLYHNTADCVPCILLHNDIKSIEEYNGITVLNIFA